MSLPALDRCGGVRLQALHDWPGQTLALLQTTPVVVRVLVASLRGSGPREPGACMLVADGALFGTVGGGHLEFQAIDAAHAMRVDGPPARLQRCILGSELGQCCGGVVELLLERWTRDDVLLLTRIADTATRGGMLSTRLEGAAPLARRRLSGPGGPPRPALRLSRDTDGVTIDERLDPAHPPLLLFGAGHVGQALVRMLGELPFATRWIDARAELFPNDTPASISRHGDPLAAVAQAAAGSRYVVMTHDHALDYQLVCAILARGDAAFVGLIGSDSKAAKFRARLARDGYTAADVARLTCPIGVAGIHSKWPAAIAVAVAAQLLQTLHAEPSRLATPTDAGCTPDQCPTCHSP